MPTLVQALEARRARERLYRFAWGVARCVAASAVLLAVCCATDWAIDRNRETPFALRVAMTALQVAVAGYCLNRFVFKLNVPSLDQLAAQAEALVPAFGHRLVTSLQLNRQSARTDGMSRQLIADVTRDAERLAAGPDFPELADRRRLTNAALLLLPILLTTAVVTAVAFGPVTTLVGRQLLLPIDIARAVRLTNATAELWPAGDIVTVTIEVAGDVAEDAVGTLKVTPEGQPAETFALKFAGRSDATSLFRAELPPASTPMSFRAWLGGGRLRSPGTIRFDSRPVVKEIEASIVLPRYVDPTGQREYVRYQPQGEVYALPDSAVEVRGEFSKPVAAATVVISRRDDKGKESEAARVALSLTESRDSGGVRFALPARASGYRIECVDDNGFKNLNPPYRGITVAADRPPEVRLLPEVLKDPKEDGPIDDFLVDGMPLRLGGQVQVGYYAKSPLGLARAYLAYRVNDGPWAALPLAATTSDDSKVGKFLPELGVFRESGAFGQVEFYPIPAADPAQDPGGLTAGGRYNFKTSALKKSMKTYDAVKEVDLEVGDAVEIRVVVYDRHPGAAQPPTAPPRQSGSSTDDATAMAVDARRPGGWSPESRIKQVVSEAKFEAWRQEHYRTRVKLSELEQKQRAVFQEPKPN